MTEVSAWEPRKMPMVLVQRYCRFSEDWQEPPAAVAHPLARRLSPAAYVAMQLWQESGLGAVVPAMASADPPAVRETAYFCEDFGEVTTNLTLASDLMNGNLPLSPLMFQNSVAHAASGYLSMVALAGVESISESSGFLSFDRALLLSFWLLRAGERKRCYVFRISDNSDPGGSRRCSGELVVLVAESRNKALQSRRSAWEFCSSCYSVEATAPDPGSLIAPGLTFLDDRGMIGSANGGLSAADREVRRGISGLGGETITSLWRRHSPEVIDEGQLLIEDLLPQKGSMQLLTDVVKLDLNQPAGVFLARLTTDKAYVDEEGGFRLEWLLEIMAQGVAALYARQSGQNGRPRLGFLIGIDAFEVKFFDEGTVKAPRIGDCLDVYARMTFDFHPVGQYEAWIEKEGVRICNASFKFMTDIEGRGLQAPVVGA